MYAAGAEHPLKQRCVAILEAIARGELVALTDVIQHIISADRHFEGLPDVVRIDPADWPG